MHVSIADLWKANRIHALALCQCTSDWSHSRPHSRGSRYSDQHMGLWCLCQTQWWSNRSAPQLKPPACPAAGFCVEACLAKPAWHPRSTSVHLTRPSYRSAHLDHEYSAAGMWSWCPVGACPAQSCDMRDVQHKNCGHHHTCCSDFAHLQQTNLIFVPILKGCTP